MSDQGALQGTGPIRLGIAVEPPLLREGLCRLLGREEGFDLVGQAGTPQEALRLAETARPDVLLLGSGLQSEARPQLLRALEKAQPSLRVLLLTEGPGSPGPAEAALLGAWGAVGVDADVKLLQKAIRTVASGEQWIGRDAVSDVLARLRRPAGRADVGWGRLALLTARELQVAAGAASGESNRALSSRLKVTEGTVKAHLGKAFKKLQVSNRAALATLIGRLDAESDARKPGTPPRN